MVSENWMDTWTDPKMHGSIGGDHRTTFGEPTDLDGEKPTDTRTDSVFPFFGGER